MYNRFELIVCSYDEYNIYKSMYGLLMEYIDEIGLIFLEIKMIFFYYNLFGN